MAEAQAHLGSVMPMPCGHAEAPREGVHLCLLWSGVEWSGASLLLLSVLAWSAALAGRLVGLLPAGSLPLSSALHSLCLAVQLLVGRRWCSDAPLAALVSCLPVLILAFVTYLGCFPRTCPALLACLLPERPWKPVGLCACEAHCGVRAQPSCLLQPTALPVLLGH